MPCPVRLSARCPLFRGQTEASEAELSENSSAIIRFSKHGNSPTVSIPVRLHQDFINSLS